MMIIMASLKPYAPFNDQCSAQNLIKIHPTEHQTFLYGLFHKGRGLQTHNL